MHEWRHLDICIGVSWHGEGLSTLLDLDRLVERFIEEGKVLAQDIAIVVSCCVDCWCSCAGLFVGLGLARWVGIVRDVGY